MRWFAEGLGIRGRWAGLGFMSGRFKEDVDVGGGNERITLPSGVRTAVIEAGRLTLVCLLLVELSLFFMLLLPFFFDFPVLGVMMEAEDELMEMVEVLAGRIC